MQPRSYFLCFLTLMFCKQQRDKGAFESACIPNILPPKIINTSVLHEMMFSARVTNLYINLCGGVQAPLSRNRTESSFNGLSLKIYFFSNGQRSKQATISLLTLCEEYACYYQHRPRLFKLSRWRHNSWCIQVCLFFVCFLRWFCFCGPRCRAQIKTERRTSPFV